MYFISYTSPYRSWLLEVKYGINKFVDDLMHTIILEIARSKDAKNMIGDGII